MKQVLYFLMLELSVAGQILGVLLCIGGGVSGSRRIQRYGAFVVATCLAIGIWLLVQHHSPIKPCPIGHSYVIPRHPIPPECQSREIPAKIFCADTGTLITVY